MKLISALLMVGILASCQSFKSQEQEQKRELANTGVWPRFLRELAAHPRVGKSVTELETEALNYIRTQARNSDNLAAMGITEEQASRIQSLSDDLPFMHKVRRWLTENFSLILRNLDTEAAAQAFQRAWASRPNRFNPYTFEAGSSVSTAIANRRRVNSPIQALSNARLRVAGQVNELLVSSRNIRGSAGTAVRESAQRMQQTLASFVRRGAQTGSRIIEAAGQLIVDAAATITRMTGKQGMGEGCPRFVDDAAADVLSTMADVEEIAAREVVNRAIRKNNGQVFEQFTEIPDSNRLTRQEILDTRVAAFQELGYTQAEARIAVNALASRQIAGEADDVARNARRGLCNLY